MDTWFCEVTGSSRGAMRSKWHLAEPYGDEYRPVCHKYLNQGDNQEVHYTLPESNVCLRCLRIAKSLAREQGND